MESTTVQCVPEMSDGQEENKVTIWPIYPKDLKCTQWYYCQQKNYNSNMPPHCLIQTS